MKCAAKRKLSKIEGQGWGAGGVKRRYAHCMDDWKPFCMAELGIKEWEHRLLGDGQMSEFC